MSSEWRSVNTCNKGPTPEEDSWDSHVHRCHIFPSDSQFGSLGVWEVVEMSSGIFPKT